MVDLKPVNTGELGMLEELGRADPRDAGGNIEKPRRELAGNQIGLITRSRCDQHVGIFGTGLGKHRRMRAVTRQRSQIEPVLKRSKLGDVGVDHRDVVSLRDQAFGHRAANPSGAKNDDLQLDGGLRQTPRERSMPSCLSLR